MGWSGFGNSGSGRVTAGTRGRRASGGGALAPDPAGSGFQRSGAIRTRACEVRPPQALKLLHFMLSDLNSYPNPNS